MLKTLNIALICGVLAAASWTYKIKHDAGLVEDELAKVERQIAMEKETIVLLEADWSLLDQPDRLQRIADAYKDTLKLEPPRPDQVVDLDGLPGPPPPPEVKEEGEGTDKPALVADAKPAAGAKPAAASGTKSAAAAGTKLAASTGAKPAAAAAAKPAGVPMPAARPSAEARRVASAEAAR